MSRNGSNNDDRINDRINDHRPRSLDADLELVEQQQGGRPMPDEEILSDAELLSFIGDIINPPDQEMINETFDNLDRETSDLAAVRQGVDDIAAAGHEEQQDRNPDEHRGVAPEEARARTHRRGRRRAEVENYREYGGKENENPEYRPSQAPNTSTSSPINKRQKTTRNPTTYMR